jgi:hypothetical protein
LPPRESDAHQNQCSRFDKSECVPCHEDARGVIRGFVAASQRHWNTAQSSDYLARNAKGGAVALNRDNDAFEFGNRAPAESLKRMQRASGRVEIRERRQNSAVKRPAGVEHDLAPPLFPSEFRKISRDFCNRVVRCGN